MHTYDANSNLSTKKDPKGQTITYGYDALNRLDLKTYPDTKTVDYVYDRGSRLKQLIDETGTIAYDYDTANRVTKVTYPDTKTVNYEYDSNSNRTKLTYPDSTYITYEYDSLNRLTNIKNQSAQAIASYSYDALSRRRQADYANSTQANYTYDYANRLTQLANRQTGQPTNFSEFSYTYDKVANRKTMATLTGTHTYTYDNIYQLKSVAYPSGYFAQNTTFNYDVVGNRNTVVTGSTTSYTANNLNQYTQVATVAYTNDANGNLTNDGTWTYTYDYENRLTQAAKTRTTSTYKYDAFGRRIQQANGLTGQQANYIYDGDQLIAEYDGAGALISKFIYGAGIDEVISLTKGSNIYYYHYDGLGSVTNLTSSSGATLESYSYDAFGSPNTSSSIGNTRMFTGREYDAETGLYYYRARYYSPVLGRFLQRDPVGYVGGINLYTYCSNNPINFVDPRGLDKQQAWWKEAWDWTWYNLLEPPYNTLFYPGSNYGEWIWGEKNLRTFYGASLDSLWLITGVYGAWEAVAASGAPYWRYTGASSKDTGWVTRGNQPPYSIQEASQRLSSHPSNPWTSVERVDVPFNRYVGGPRPAAPKPFGPGGSYTTGRGAEYKIGGFGDWVNYIKDWKNAILK